MFESVCGFVSFYLLSSSEPYTHIHIHTHSHTHTKNQKDTAINSVFHTHTKIHTHSHMRRVLVWLEKTVQKQEKKDYRR